MNFTLPFACFSSMKGYALLAFSFCSAILSVGAQNASAVPVVDLGYSKYQGFYNETSDITSFLGIRFAAPPTGEFLLLAV